MSSRLDVLDGMRGLAILMVLVFHVNEATGVRFEFPQIHPILSLQTFGSVGFMGVEVFFFLSGFCLFYPFARHMLDGQRRPGWTEFAYRRFIKIVPSYAIALTFIAIAVHAAYPSWQAFSIDYLRHLFFVHTWWRESFFSVSGPFWTLGIEVQFYVLFPFMAVAAMRSPILTWIAVTALAVAYRAWILANNSYADTTSSDQLPAMLDLFATGMLGAYLYVRWRPVFERSARARGIATAIAVAAGIAFAMLLQSLVSSFNPVDVNFAYYRWQTEHRCAFELTILVLVLASGFGGVWLRRVIANPALVWLSVISYNLYLWNKIVVQSCHDHGFPCSLSPNPWLTTSNWGWTFFFGSMLISLGIAAIVTYAFERPLLRLRPAWLERERRTAQKPGSSPGRRPLPGTPEAPST